QLQGDSRSQSGHAGNMDPGTRRNRAQEGDFQEEEEEVDPRIQGELEKLNQSTDDINRRETELEVHSFSLLFL
uniref:SH3 domain-binding protein 5 n=1 Tax=Sphenodon punctatus TaxID=8508 RepID=A0A8D0H1B7_SPHPU